MSLTERARMMSRQGVPMPTLAQVMVADAETQLPVTRDGAIDGRGHAARQYADEGLSAQ